MSSKASKRTRLLKSGIDMYANRENVSYWAELQHYPTRARVCLEFTVQNRLDRCPKPYLQVRLTGAAILRIRIKPYSKTNQQQQQEHVTRLSGCAYLPVPGKYYVDANLVTCTVDEKSALRLSATALAKKCVVLPDTQAALQNQPIGHNAIQPYSFRQEPFERPPNDDSENIPTTWWIYAPTCRPYPENDRLAVYDRSENCTAAAGDPPFVPTKYQLDELLPYYGWNGWSDPTEFFRFDQYLWMRVYPTTGRVEYRPRTYGTPVYMPQPPSYLLNPHGRRFDGQICFVGDSHARYLYHETRVVINNLTKYKYFVDGCVHDIYTETEKNHPRFLYSALRFVDEWLDEDHTVELQRCTHVVVSHGHWQAGWPREHVTTPHDFQQWTLRLLQTLEKVTFGTKAPIWLTSLNLTPLGFKALSCPPQDWRLGPIVDAYNTVMKKLLQMPQNVTKLRTTTRFLDNSDMNDPLWDSSLDWVHPCRNVFRPLAGRLLRVILRQAAS